MEKKDLTRRISSICHECKRDACERIAVEITGEFVDLYLLRGKEREEFGDKLFDFLNENLRI